MISDYLLNYLYFIDFLLTFYSGLSLKLIDLSEILLGTKGVAWAALVDLVQKLKIIIQIRYFF